VLVGENYYGEVSGELDDIYCHGRKNKSKKKSKRAGGDLVW